MSKSECCANGNHPWCMNRDPMESHCTCDCHQKEKSGANVVWGQRCVVCGQDWKLGHRCKMTEVGV